MKHQDKDWEGVPEEYRNISSDSLRFKVAWLLQRFVLFPAFGFYTRFLNKTEFIGLENLDELKGKTFLVCPNHTSSWDIWSAFEVGFKAQKGFFASNAYMCGLGAIERLGNSFTRWFATAAGVLAVNRKKGLDQWALQDVDRLLRERKKDLACLIYPEGTRSRTGRLARTYKAGAGWLQAVHQVPVVPVYQMHYNNLPGFGRKLKIVIGKPMYFEEYAEKKDSPTTWIAITGKIMDELRRMEEIHNPLSEEDRAEMQAVKDSLARDMRPRFPEAAQSFCKDMGLKLPVLGVLPLGLKFRDRLPHELGEKGMLGFASTAWSSRDRLNRLMDEMAELKHPWGVEWFHNSWQNEAQRMTRMEEIAGKAPAILVRSCPAPSPEVVLARLRGITENRASKVFVRVSLPETAALFSQPAPQSMVEELLKSARLTEAEAQRASSIPLATHIVVDGGAESRDLMTLLPAIRRVCKGDRIRIGIAGSVGTPDALEGVLAMGASFVLFENVFQALEGSSLGSRAQDMVHKMRISDVQKSWFPEGYEFQLKEDTVRAGTLYCRRAERLHEILASVNLVEELEASQIKELQDRYFQGKELESVLEEAQKTLQPYFPDLCEAARDSDGLRRLNLIAIYWIFSRLEDAESEEPRDPMNLLIRGDGALANLVQWMKSAPAFNRLPTEPAQLLERLCREAGLEPLQKEVSGMLERVSEGLKQS